MEKKSFRAQKMGLIKGGNLTYEFDSRTGNIHYSGVVRAGWGFLSKEFNTEGNYKVDPEQMKSAAFRKEGAEIQIDILKITIQSVHGFRAQGKIELEGQKSDGIIVLNLENEYVEPMSLDVTTTYMGYDVHLILS